MSQAQDPLIVTRDLVKVYSSGSSQLVALNKVNLTFDRGEFAGLVGPSGSGKTTLLNIIGSLDKPSEGSAVVLGEHIEDLSHQKAAELRRRGPERAREFSWAHSVQKTRAVYEQVGRH